MLQYSTISPVAAAAAAAAATTAATSASGTSQTFDLIAIGNTIGNDNTNSKIQLFPLSTPKDSDDDDNDKNEIVLAKDGTKLSFDIDEHGRTFIQGTNKRLTIGDDNKLSANSSGTTIFYIVGQHLHYNEHFIFLACPRESGNNNTFTVYASTDTGMCDEGVLFTFKPQLNNSEPLSSFIPSVLAAGSTETHTTSGGGATSNDIETSGNTISTSFDTRGTRATNGAGKTSLTLASSSKTTATTATNGNRDTTTPVQYTLIRGTNGVPSFVAITTTKSNVVVETLGSSTIVKTSDDNVVTETIVIGNEETISSSNDEDNTMASESLVVTTSTSCADTACHTMYVGLFTITVTASGTVETATAGDSGDTSSLSTDTGSNGLGNGRSSNMAATALVGLAGGPAQLFLAVISLLLL